MHFQRCHQRSEVTPAIMIFHSFNTIVTFPDATLSVGVRSEELPGFEPATLCKASKNPAPSTGWKKKQNKYKQVRLNGIKTRQTWV